MCLKTKRMAVVFVKTGCIFGFTGSPPDRMFEAKGDSRTMQITDLLVPERVALNVQVADKGMAIHAMVGMLDRTGCLRDVIE